MKSGKSNRTAQPKRFEKRHFKRMPIARFATGSLRGVLPASPRKGEVVQFAVLRRARDGRFNIFDSGKL